MLLSVVIPVYNETANIDLLTLELQAVLEKLVTDYEIIFVDDGSMDETFTLIKTISAMNPRVKGISLSRNFGHQVALHAGLERSSGDVTITMDGDLQHPPGVIPELLAKHQQGYHVVNTIREETKGVSLFKKLTSALFYKMINAFSDLHIHAASADFRLMDRKFLDAFLLLTERDRFTRGLVSWLGFKQAFIPYTSPSRKHGKSKFTFRKMFRFALDGITSFSARPLRFSLYVGLFVFVTGIVYACYALYEYFHDQTVRGWASLLITVLILGGIQLFTIGVIGEYLARVFNEAKHRPLYLVKEEAGFEKK
jgi:dolichol-phosphate mannosyltransferase